MYFRVYLIDGELIIGYKICVQIRLNKFIRLDLNEFRFIQYSLRGIFMGSGVANEFTMRSQNKGREEIFVHVLCIGHVLSVLGRITKKGSEKKTMRQSLHLG